MKSHTAAVVPLRPLARARPPRAAGPAKASPAPLDAGMSIGAAFEAVMGANVAHLRANDRGVLEGGDPEYLHQTRVALRRLRSGVSIFAPVLPDAFIGHLGAELKWLSGRLGPARDWDVFILETLPPVAEAFGPHPGLARFAARCETMRRAVTAQARRAVRSARYERLVQRLEQCGPDGDWASLLDSVGRAALAQPLVGFAPGVLESRYERVLRKGRSIGRLDARELHRLRIAIKKFRYAADFFAALYDEKRTRPALKRLSRLQDILGAMNDAATVARLAAEGFKGMSGATAREARGFVLGWSRGRTAMLRRQLKSAWKEFAVAGKFW